MIEIHPLVFFVLCAVGSFISASVGYKRGFEDGKRSKISYAIANGITDAIEDEGGDGS